ncbi:hypothetical protein J5N97_001917 [Dioscorea zingiberensis]|uniref:Uncharacterized protein n=1 Tax=Dioscorea zingiberensis TaxID=325984 RepID=A0A9D5H1Y2_9LILI|nr:hypothetical protein J5N97_001917 [Dioscorea zingiberensis]
MRSCGFLLKGFQESSSPIHDRNKSLSGDYKYSPAHDGERVADHWVPIGWARISEIVQTVQPDASWDSQQFVIDDEDDFTVADLAAPYWERPVGPVWWCHVSAGHPQLIIGSVMPSYSASPYLVPQDEIELKFMNRRNHGRFESFSIILKPKKSESYRRQPIAGEQVEVRKMELQELVQMFQHEAETHALVAVVSVFQNLFGAHGRLSTRSVCRGSSKDMRPMTEESASNLLPKVDGWNMGGLTENDFILAAKINALDMQNLMRRKATD